MEDFAAVLKATVMVYATFAPAIIVPCLLSLATDRQGTSEKGR
ncbi:hypothetical protein [uncultured Cloacibacillus sp.]